MKWWKSHGCIDIIASATKGAFISMFMVTGFDNRIKTVTYNAVKI